MSPYKLCGNTRGDLHLLGFFFVGFFLELSVTLYWEWFLPKASCQCLVTFASLALGRGPGCLHIFGGLCDFILTLKKTQKTFTDFFFSSPFLAVLGLCCCTWAFSSCSGQGLLSSCSMWAFHCAGFSCGAHAGFSRCASWLWSMGSVVVAHRLSCPLAFGIFLNQGLNLCSLCCKVDS